MNRRQAGGRGGRFVHRFFPGEIRRAHVAALIARGDLTGIALLRRHRYDHIQAHRRDDVLLLVVEIRAAFFDISHDAATCFLVATTVCRGYGISAEVCLHHVTVRAICRDLANAIAHREDGDGGIHGQRADDLPAGVVQWRAVPGHIDRHGSQ